MHIDITCLPYHLYYILVWTHVYPTCRLCCFNIFRSKKPISSTKLMPVNCDAKYEKKSRKRQYRNWLKTSWLKTREVKESCTCLTETKFCVLSQFQVLSLIFYFNILKTFLQCCVGFLSYNENYKWNIIYIPLSPPSSSSLCINSDNISANIFSNDLTVCESYHIKLKKPLLNKLLSSP